MRIAAAQFRPVWLDPAATTKKVLDVLAEAAQHNVDVLAFPETFLSGYPFWVERTGGATFNDARQKQAYGMYLDAAVEVAGTQVETIVEAVRGPGCSPTSAYRAGEWCCPRRRLLQPAGAGPHPWRRQQSPQARPDIRGAAGLGHGDAEGLRVHSAGASAGMRRFYGAR